MCIYNGKTAKEFDVCVSRSDANENTSQVEEQSQPTSGFTEP